MQLDLTGQHLPILPSRVKQAIAERFWAMANNIFGLMMPMLACLLPNSTMVGICSPLLPRRCFSRNIMFPRKVTVRHLPVFDIGLFYPVSQEFQDYVCK